MKENLEKYKFIGELSNHIGNLKELLNTPANEEMLQEIEKIAGTKLPQKFKNLYLIHNGETESVVYGSMLGMRWMDIQSIKNQIKSYIKKFTKDKFRRL